MYIIKCSSNERISLFYRIMDSPKTELTDGQKEKIASVLCLFHENSKIFSEGESKTCGQINFYTVDDLLTATKSLPLGHRRKLEKIRISVLGPVSGKIITFFLKYTSRKIAF